MKLKFTHICFEVWKGSIKTPEDYRPFSVYYGFEGMTAPQARKRASLETESEQRRGFHVAAIARTGQGDGKLVFQA